MDIETKKAMEHLFSEQGFLFKEFKDYTNEQLAELHDAIKGVQIVQARPLRGSEFTQSKDFEYTKAFDKYIRTGDMEVKTMTISGADGSGIAVPTELDSALKNYMNDASAMRQVCTVKQISSAKHTKVVNTGGLAAGWVGEESARAETGTPTLAEITAPTGELYASPASSQWMVDDAGFDLQGWLLSEIQGKFASMEGDAFLNGTGTNQPKGLLQYTMTTQADDVRTFGTLKNIVTANTAAITGDELLDTVYDLRGAYRKGAVWVMNSLTLAFIRKLKDSNGQYLWAAGLQSGQPGTLLGYSVYVDESMPDIGIGATPIAFGNFKLGYEILDRNTNLLIDPYTNKPFQHYYVTKRVSGMLVDSNAIRIVAMAAA